MLEDGILLFFIALPAIIAWTVPRLRKQSSSGNRDHRHSEQHEILRMYNRQVLFCIPETGSQYSQKNSEPP